MPTSALADSDGARLTTPYQQQCINVLNLNACIDDMRCQNEAVASASRASATNSQQKGVVEQRFLDLNVLIDDNRSQRSSDTPKALRSDTPNALSDASTATPREPIEEISIHEVLDASLIADIMPVEAANMHAFKPALAAAGTHVQRNDGWQYLQPGPGCVPQQEHYPCPTVPMNQGCPQLSQLPLTCPAVSGQVWPPQWQWTAPPMSTPLHSLNSIAPQFSATDARH